ncbi:MAG: ABC transporter substrate-binding protein, partial [Bacteroidota bacterium]
AWLLSGGGQELWDKIYEPFDLIPMPGGNTGVQMGGWFNREINTLEDLSGLKMRIPGLGGKVMSKAGVTAMAVAGSEVFTNLERGVLDATEWIGPFHDYLMGFHKIARYYYYPGWHEPGTTLELIVNRRLMLELPSDLQQIVRMAAQWINVWTLSEFEARNAEYLQKILDEAEVELRTFPKEITDQLRVYTQEAIEELVSGDAEAQAIYDSYRSYHERALAWSNLTERAYFNSIRPDVS